MIDKWEVIFSEQSIDEIRNIHDYIAYELLAPENARKQVDRIILKAESLDISPMRNPLYDNKKWKKKGLRRMVVDNFLIFYLTCEKSKQVQIVSILYGARDIDNIIE
ncbi:MAG: type II toxin-antitoxin system RelE/ParE family toxin [Bacillota bacterium]